MIKKIETSRKTIIFTFCLLLGLWFLYIVRDILLQFFVAFIIASILNPLINSMTGLKISRSVAVLIIYSLLIVFIGFVIAAIAPTLIEQTSAFINNLPNLVSDLGISSVVSGEISQQFVSQIGSIPSTVVKFGVSVFSNVLGVFAMLVFAFYLLAERDRLQSQLEKTAGVEKKEQLLKTLSKIELRLGNWARGELVLMFVVWAANYIGFRLLNFPFALPLAILAGLLEVVPYIGPVIAAVPAVIIGLGISPIMGLAAATLAFLVQQMENYLFVPKIMQKSAGVDPIVTLFCLAIGFRLSGITGLLISVPIFLTLEVLYQEGYFKKYFLNSVNS